MSGSTGKYLSCLTILVLTTVGRAEAYVDPATGSFVLQMLIAGLVGALFALKLFWHRLVRAVGGLFRRSPQPDPDEG